MLKCSLCDDLPADVRRTLILSTPCWRVVVAPNQALLGRTYVTLQRHAASLAELVPSEVEDWLRIIKRLEPALQQAFGAAMFNWQCNLNWAYQEEPPIPHVHWHVLPRYRTTVTQFGYSFVDPEFGDLFRSRTQEMPRETLVQIADRIKLYLGES